MKKGKAGRYWRVWRRLAARRMARAARGLRQRASGKRRSVVMALAVAAVMSVGGYFANNLPLFTGEQFILFNLTARVKASLGLQRPESDDVTYINVSCDKEVVPFRGNLAVPIGKRAVTSRPMLLRLLTALDSMARHDKDAYRYIMLDIRFEEGYDSEVDSLLFSLIHRMDRIVVAAHGDVALADSARLLPKAGRNDYMTSVLNTSMVRYRYLQGDDHKSLPLRVYNGLEHRDIHRHGIVYTDGGRLCYNSVFLHFPVLDTDAVVPAGVDEAYGSHLLGNDILHADTSEPLPDVLRRLCRGKIVVVGDMDEDVHDTYMGKVPGAVASFRAFDTLRTHRHWVNWWLEALYFLLYALIAFGLLRRGVFLRRFFPFLAKSPSKLLRFAGSMVRYGLVLLLCSVLLSLFFDVHTSFFFASLCFAALDMFINYKRYNK